MQCVKPLSFGIAAGIVVSAYMLILGMLSMLFGIGTELIQTMSTFYIGYGNSLVGILIGVGWGFLEGFICGYLIILICIKLNRKGA